MFCLSEAANRLAGTVDYLEICYPFEPMDKELHVIGQSNFQLLKGYETAFFIVIVTPNISLTPR